MRPSPAGGEVGRIRRLVVKHARDAFQDSDAIAREWHDLNYTAAPDFGAAVHEYEAFLSIVTSLGAEVLQLPKTGSLSLDSMYVRDASIVTPRGMVLCRMGKPQREPEPEAQREAMRRWDMPIAGEITAPGTIEGGDVIWLDEHTVIVGRGYRTNEEGIRQFRALLGDTIESFITVPLPHWNGPGDVFHLMSIVSPVDRDLAVVYSPLMSVPFRELLLHRGLELVEVPRAEFESQGTNVLAIAPRVCVMLEGNPLTRAALEQAGALVHTYRGDEISLKGGGGPTCLTRPVARETESA